MSIPEAPFTAVDPQSLLDALTREAQPLTNAQLSDCVKRDADDRGFINAVETLEREGRIVRNRAGLLLVAARVNLLSGQVQGHRDGFGFLLRDDRGADLVLSEHEMSKVLHGDRVLARVRGNDRRGRPEGEIVEVIERRTNRLVGRFLNERGVSIVVPEDQRIQHDILVPNGATLAAMHGQVVVVEIVQQPQRYVQPVGRVVEVLGAIDDPGMEIEIAVRKFAVPHEFSTDALEAAKQLPHEVRPRDQLDRIDLRDVPLVTIDGADARDFDDAVYCEPLAGRGKGWRLIVAIADVSHYVTPTSPLDVDAQARSTSVYFPRRVIPMLPEELSNGLCSLKPRVDRLALVCDMVINTKGQVKAYQFFPALMHSAARLTYDEVWDALSVPNSRAAEKLAPLSAHLRELHALYDVLAAARKERGALEIETTETYIVCDPNGRIERIVPRTRNDAHRIIEECMLAANVCTADFIQRHKHAVLYRVHEGPTPPKLANLRALLKTLGLTLEGAEEPTPADYAQLIQKIRMRPDAQLLQNVLLRSMQQAVYSPHNAGHFGLAYGAYAHFTSPIRRYPDLLVHRVIKAILGRNTHVPQVHGVADTALPADDTGKGAITARWEKLGFLCSANERRADDASRDVESWLKSYYVRERVGETFSGSISSVVPFGIFVVLDDLYVEGLVHVSELGSEYFHYNEALHELRGERTGIRFKLADRVTIQVARVDLEARRVDFRLVTGDARKALVAATTDAEGQGSVRKTEKKVKPGEGTVERKARQSRRAERLASRKQKSGKAGKAEGASGQRAAPASQRRRRRP